MKTPIERLLSKIQKDDSTGCWNWAAGIRRDGYGQFSFCGKQHGAHRVSFILHKGEIPEGKEICHTCDNPLCINPDHLFADTHRGNLQDALGKGRVKTGSKSINAKLSQEQISQIVQMRSSGARQNLIAATFDVSEFCIAGIVHGHTYRKEVAEAVKELFVTAKTQEQRRAA